MKKKMWFVLCIMTSILLTTACGEKKEPGEEKKKQPFRQKRSCRQKRLFRQKQNLIRSSREGKALNLV